MPYSHHSHSGQFCGHAVDQLAEVLEHAFQDRKMTAFHLTEHCPRSDAHLYAEEIQANVDSGALVALYDKFVVEALHLREIWLQKAAKDSLERHILIGFEAEWIEPAASAAEVQRLLGKYGHAIDYFIGSVHHVKEIPIDFDRALYLEARNACGTSDDDLFAEYLDNQFDMLRTLQPAVVGHFDLIRLFSDQPDRDLSTCAEPRIWEKVIRNLEFAKSIDAVLEINTAGLRKGMNQPYPRKDICLAWLRLGGQFVLSDDSHGRAHVGTNYGRVMSFLDELGLDSLVYLVRNQSGKLDKRLVPMAQVKKHPFWSALE